jgi:RNA polymerase sigma-70 factor (ECF subfamily)
MNNNTGAILQAFQKGDRVAFSHVFDTYYRQLIYFARKLTDNSAEAEDVVMDAFYQLFDRCAQFQTLPAIRSFLYVAVRNAGIDALRSRKSYEARNQAFFELAADDNLAYEQMRGELLAEIFQAAGHLPVKCRTVFFKLYKDGLKPVEVANELGISVENVYNHQKNAMKMLRLRLIDRSPMYLLSLVSILGVLHRLRS